MTFSNRAFEIEYTLESDKRTASVSGTLTNLLEREVGTVLLSFHDWGQYKGIEPVLILKNWQEIWSDSYFHEMFARTFRIAALATLITAVFGAPEAYILNRMRAPWKGIFLLVILGPLLISVVARTLGWALLFGGQNGIVGFGVDARDRVYVVNLNGQVSRIDPK